MRKICQECGQPFETNNGMQKFCNRKHYRICKVCGKQFEVTRYHLTAKDAKTTCSKSCTIELRKRTCNQKYGGNAPASSKEVQEKMEATMLKRYGVEHPAQSEEIKSKIKITNKSKYGVEWFQQSLRGKEIISNSWKDEDIRKRRLEHISKTNIARYGSKSSLSNEDVRNKAKQTNFKNTGYYEPFANPEVQSKIEKTNLERYGVRRPLQADKIKEKTIQTNLKKYGTENPVQNINIKRKIQQTCLERYGNTCYLQSDLGKSVIQASMISKYGYASFTQTSEWKASRMLDPTKIDNLMEFRSDPSTYILFNYSEKPSIRELSENLGIHENTVGQIILEFNCTDLVTYVYSYMEEEVFNFIKSIDPLIEVQRNVHNIITPLELDLYLPDYKLGIECNPTSTHNSTINSFDKNAAPLKPNYHLVKTQQCEEKGIFLFHIFGSEWTYSSEILKSMIRNLLGKCETKVYARNCIVKPISSNICKDFLNENHRQGNVYSKIRLGLYLDDKLVSVMTFGRMRATIGTDKTDLSDCWELVRFCSLLNTTVIGGASKLFTYFVRNYDPERIRSFSDRAHTRGYLYEKLGFKKIRESDPGYVWVDSRTDISYHRYSAQKRNLKQFLQDDSIDLSKTEKQIMEEHRFLQVFDSGTITWEWDKNNQI